MDCLSDSFEEERKRVDRWASEVCAQQLRRQKSLHCVNCHRFHLFLNRNEQNRKSFGTQILCGFCQKNDHALRTRSVRVALFAESQIWGDVWDIIGGDDDGQQCAPCVGERVMCRACHRSVKRMNDRQVRRGVEEVVTVW